jgi:hypothetical protein
MDEEDLSDVLIHLNRARLKVLLAAERKLRALENAGVDNWEWYGEAMASMEEND